MTEERWRTHFLILVGSLAVFSSLVFGFVLLVDPYDNVPFSPPLDRRPVDKNQRFSFPAIARDPSYDSAIFGTSTMGLLDPRRLGRALDGDFANLSLHAGTAWEQSQLIAVFNRHHPRSQRLILGIDEVWCTPGEELKRLTDRLFPAWMYDESRWNDLPYLFNDRALDNAWLQLRVMLGFKDARFRRDGYRNFLPPDGEYHPVRARETIYGPTPPPEPLTLSPDAVRPSCRRPRMQFPAMEILREVLSQTPNGTEIDIVFVPYHLNKQRSSATEIAACKARVLELASRREKVRVLDFMIPSRITRDDANYWDMAHYREPVAREIELLLVEGIREQGPSPLFERLSPRRCDPGSADPR